MNIIRHSEQRPHLRYMALILGMILFLWPAVAYANPGPGSIAGTVSAAGGTPVAGATVCAFDYYTYSLIDCAPSAGDGSYLISGLPASDYRVEVSASGYAFEMYDDYHYGYIPSSTPVTVSDDTTTSGIDFELEPGGDISGTVYESDGVTPVEDISVMVHFPDGSFRATCTDANGDYTLGRVLHGISVLVQAESVLNYCGGPENFFDEYWEEAPVEAAATPITLNAGTPNAPGVDFTLDDGADTTGRIFGFVTEEATGDPVSGAYVCAFDYYTYSLIDCEPSGADGSYLISGLPASDYRVEVSAAGYAFEMYDDYHYGGISLATAVGVYEGYTASSIDFELEPGGDVSGTVYESDGVTPIQDISVRIIFPDGSSRGNCTDASGNYTIGRVIHGVPLVVQAESVMNYCGGPENFFTEYWEEAPVEAAATPITLSAGLPNAPGIDFTLNDGADTSGRIFGFVTEEATGDPIPGARVCAFNFDTLMQWDCVTSGADGSYLISGAPAADYRLEVHAAGYAFEMYDDVLYGPVDAATRVTVYQGLTTGGIDFELEPGGNISGTVYESDGVTPMEDVSVVIIYPDGSIRGSCTDASGHYSSEVYTLPYGVPVRVKAYAEGNYCGGPENFFEEYWEEAEVEADATALVLSSGTPAYTGIDFTLTQFVYTPAGTNVVINPTPDVEITFDEVTVPGGTAVEAIPAGDPPPPDGFRFLGTYYEIRSEAEFTTAQVCFTYNDSGLTPFEEAGLRLYHFEGGAWVDVTDPGYPDVDANVLCGTVSDFSPFGLMVPLNQPPVCDAATPSLDLLWPPDHSFVPINILGVADPDGDPISITFDAIFQDEAVNGRGSGSTAPDGQGVGTSTAYVRAERSGSGNGRYYHISFTADDGRGGTCSGTVMVGVPLNQGRKGAPVDDGPLYDSTVVTEVGKKGK